MSYWSWDPTARRYRITSEGASVLGQRAGTFISPTKLAQFSEELQGTYSSRLKELTTLLSQKQLSLEDFGARFSSLLADSHSLQYVLSRGGFNQMTNHDWSTLDKTLQNQAGYLTEFLKDIQAERYSVAGINQRAQLYINATTESFWRGMTGYLGLTLPAYPGDGSSECKTNCKCSWRIIEKAELIECYWVLDDAEHCPTCSERAQTWNPLRILKLPTRNVATAVVPGGQNSGAG